MSAYTKAGVNVPLGDAFSAFAHRISRETWDVSPFVTVIDFAEGTFRGPRGWIYNLPQGYIHVGGPDGIGTKTILHTEAMSHHLAARDLLAMTCGDITRYGGMPLIFTNVLDVETLGESTKDDAYRAYCRALVGLRDAARVERVVLMYGETAELGACVGSENPDASTKFNWAGFAQGVTYQPKIIDGSKVRPGDAVVALNEHGFRSNGISLVRKALRYRFGDIWWDNVEAQTAIRAAAAPSVLYDQLLCHANGWFREDRSLEPEIEVHAIAHISGGSIPSKFGSDILGRCGYSAMLDELWEPAAIMQHCKVWAHLSDCAAYETWNGGQGLLVVLPHEVASRFCSLAQSFGIRAKICGSIIEPEPNKPPSLKVRSKYVDSKHPKDLEWVFG